MKQLIAALAATPFLLFAQPKPPAGAAYLNSKLPIEQRVKDLMGRMTVEEKAGQLNQLNGGVFTGPAANDPGQKAKMELVQKGKVGSMLNVTGVSETRVIQEIAVKESRLGIPLLFAFDVIHGFKTIFPVPLAEACSWDTSLARQSAAIAAREASAEGLHWTFAPMMDISRDPRWGRVMEGAGEDPFLGSAFAQARVRGFQGNFGETNILACAKHFGMYGASEGGREYNQVDVSRINAMNFYMPPYKAAVDAGVATIMNAFNVYEGVPASGNKFLIKDVLQKQWGFNGLLVSDWKSFGEMVTHGFAANNKEAAMLALNAGSMMDMESGTVVTYVPELVKEGKVSMATLDNAVARVLYWKFRLGLFENPYRNCNPARAAADVFTDAHRKQSREAAQRSVVLLKNERGALPLQQATQRILVVGHLAQSSDDIYDFWIGKALGHHVPVTLLQGLQNAFGGTARVLFAQGYTPGYETSTALKEEAIQKAAGSDVVVVNVGISGKMAGEDRSLAMPEIPAGQIELLQALRQLGKKVVAVVSAGRPLVLTKIEPLCDAIVYGWILGTEHGNALADVLTGAVNPSAKTVMSFPYAVGQIPVYYNHMNTGRPEQTDGMGNWYSRYRDIPRDPLYPFGFGLSYTSFAYSNIRLSKATIAAKEEVAVQVDVTNTGSLAGEEIVQLYIADPAAGMVRPVKELKGFLKVKLQPGQRQTVRFTLNRAALSYLTASGMPALEPGLVRVYAGGNSNDLLEADLLVK